MAADAPAGAPDPYSEIRLLSLRSLRGANFWSRRPITRLDLDVGSFEDISSADVPGFTDALVKALPGLRKHRCSIGQPGGFITRLRRGTYAPHIAEHVGLELQTMVGHDVGYGRARGGDRDGEYTVVFEHFHAEVGTRSAALALEVVQRAFAGELDAVDYAVAELEALAALPDVPAVSQEVVCGITGGEDRAEVRDEMARLGVGGDQLVVEVAPSYVLNAGLPYARSEIAVILDAFPVDVPDRYRETDRARQLVSTLADAVRRDGIVVCPAKEWEVQDRARDAGCRVAVFATHERVTRRDTRVAHSVASVRDGCIVVEIGGEVQEATPLRPDVAIGPQVAAALAVRSLEQLRKETSGSDGSDD